MKNKLTKTDGWPRWLSRLVGRFLCRIGHHDADGAGYPWGIRCTRCGKTGHHYDQNYWGADTDAARQSTGEQGT